MKQKLNYAIFLTLLGILKLGNLGAWVALYLPLYCGAGVKGACDAGVDNIIINGLS